jgi:8-oxo-dGTP pyrophosphatase MutT (NUDIX family)
LRELREETGISKVKVISGFRESIHYFFREKNELVSKDVVFLLAESEKREVVISSEHVGFEWLSFENALERLTFKNAKQVLEKAEGFLEKRKGLVRTA